MVAQDGGWNPIDEKFPGDKSRESIGKSTMPEEFTGKHKAEVGAGLFKPFEEQDLNSLPNSHPEEKKKNLEDELDSMLAELDGGTENTQNTETANRTPEQNPESSEIQRRIDEGIHTPLIQTLRESGRIDPENESLTLEHFANGGDIDRISQIAGINVEDAENIQDFLHYTTTESATEQAVVHFKNDFGDAFESFKTNDNTFRSERTEEAYDMIASHYFLLGEEGSETTQEVRDNAMNAAILTALNIEIDGKSFPRNESFNILNQSIRNEGNSVEERFSAFLKLRNMIDTTQGRGGKKQSEAFRTSQAKKVKQSQMTKDFFNQKEVEQATKTQINMNEGEDNGNNIKETENEGGEIFAFGDLDKLGDNGETPQKSV